ncbi:MAG: type II toxin-antitoxin system VapC family toxin [Microscillaceae bacterium]|nr:type II toxin-antitoxin system VapC family toxin [Microscillaceae bacterium]
MNYLLDTSVIVHLIRNSPTWQKIKQIHHLDQEEHHYFISVVSVGEILSFSRRNKWQEKKIKELDRILAKFDVLDINVDEVLLRYADIDTFSQGKDEDKSLPQGLSARNMGKNDIWIAATASVIQAHLLTLDKDFDHLHQVFFEVITLEN